MFVQHLTVIGSVVFALLNHRQANRLDLMFLKQYLRFRYKDINFIVKPKHKPSRCFGNH